MSQRRNRIARAGKLIPIALAVAALLSAGNTVKSDAVTLPVPIPRPLPIGQNPEETSLAEALAQPHGPAAGDGVLRRTIRVIVDPGAKLIASGTQKEGKDVIMSLVRPVDRALDEQTAAGGCILGYGKGSACLPASLPSHAGHLDPAHTYTCTEVRTLLPKGIAVNSVEDGTSIRGVDPLSLDSNRDRTACGPGDR